MRLFCCRSLPTRTFAFQSELCAPGHESSKETVTVLCCASSTVSHKINFRISGKKNPSEELKTHTGIGQNNGNTTDAVLYDVGPPFAFSMAVIILGMDLYKF
jgi:hypothetical protein